MLDGTCRQGPSVPGVSAVRTVMPPSLSRPGPSRLARGPLEDPRRSGGNRVVDAMAVCQGAGMREETFFRIVDAWHEVAGVPMGSPDHKINVVVSPGSHVAPTGWVGAVRLANHSTAARTLITTPDERQAARVRDELRTVAADYATDRATWGALLPSDSGRDLRPADLAYSQEPDLEPAADGVPVEDNA